MKLILDFDRVLFDHDALRAAMEQKSLAHLYAEPELWDHIHPSDFLYADVIPFLSSYKKADITIVSAYTARIGTNAEVYQKRKIVESGITDYVQDIVIMDGSKAPHVSASTADRAIFVDDKRTYVEEVFNLCTGVTAVQLLRPNAERAKNDVIGDVTLPIAVVHDLAELSAIIESL